MGYGYLAPRCGIQAIEVPTLGIAGEITATIEHLDLIAGSYLHGVAAHALDATPYDYYIRLYPVSVHTDTAEYRV